MADLILEYTTSDNKPVRSAWLNSHSNVFNPETGSRIVSGDYIDAVMEYRKTSGVLRSISMLMTENGML